MNTIKISPDFNLDDIRKIRNANSERHLKMTASERLDEAKKTNDWFIELMGKSITITTNPK